mmetsp:Transcript_38006/g.70129  ORF Transcript_38006/g.70129 Transcript_38006/m.70129 type:complete len:264 (-) Transcript_38006:59-850(-)|eukprot:CAMPEP_0197455220 /NCGR_PEP_ID=MMETSP1175-20131217/40195_1 /TAXON_ID=1003142 /ORGANISM="Triceratium dubium, Strain CCMP147" /LENGTH=263 /DNA_ID=CAMNT_0042989011 /DNA_START=217 /DNA_END=1008 /DNA_ORIENTATION=-
MPRSSMKRKAENIVDMESSSAKCQKETLNNIADECTCPITLELPLDPVVAQDGHIYERSAITELIKQKGNALKSPISNEPMGRQLLPVVQVRNLIEELVKSGMIEGDKASRWKQKIKDEDNIASLKEAAEKGDPAAMSKLGHAFYYGSHSQKKNYQTAFGWFKKSADQNYPPGMCGAGTMLVNGYGVEKNAVEGMMLVGMAARSGSATAAYNLGKWYAKGKHGLPCSISRAKEFLQMSVDGGCKFPALTDENKRAAFDLLKEL